MQSPSWLVHHIGLLSYEVVVSAEERKVHESQKIDLHHEATLLIGWTAVPSTWT